MCRGETGRKEEESIKTLELSPGVWWISEYFEMWASDSYFESQMMFCWTSACVTPMPDGFVKTDGPTSLPQIRVSLIIELSRWIASMHFSLTLRRRPEEAARTGTSCQFTSCYPSLNIWSDGVSWSSPVCQKKPKTSTSCVSSLPNGANKGDRSPSGGRQRLPTVSAEHLHCILCRRGGECMRTTARGSCRSLVPLLDLSYSIYLFSLVAPGWRNAKLVSVQKIRGNCTFHVLT